MIKNIEIKIFLISIIIMTGISLIFENIFYKNFQNQFLLFLIPLIWPGLAHGSLDIQIAQRAKIITNNRELSVFLCLYIFLAFILCWGITLGYAFIFIFFGKFLWSKRKFWSFGTLKLIIQ